MYGADTIILIFVISVWVILSLKDGSQYAITSVSQIVIIRLIFVQCISADVWNYRIYINISAI